MSKSTSASASGHALWTKMPKANAELFALTYGALVTELVRDYENIPDIHQQLEKIGHSMGVRCVDEFLAKAELAGVSLPPCGKLKDTAEMVAKMGFKMFLGVTADVAHVTDSGFSLLLQENPLSLFCELPEQYAQLKYSNLYCGVVRGALEQVNLKVECTFVKDTLHGDETNEIKVELKEVLQDGAGDDYKEE
mmetsp:Transcript_37228/g.57172  ORF Transcript_37228/g.57172 Transcript_37228/m.57172 type:complete len:193 (-) Transcript_37228:3-581(-)